MGATEVDRTLPVPLPAEETEPKQNLQQAADQQAAAKRKDIEGKTEERELIKVTDDDFYRFMVSDFHGIARCKYVTKSAFPYMRKRGPGM